MSPPISELIVQTITFISVSILLNKNAFNRNKEIFHIILKILLLVFLELVTFSNILYELVIN